MQCKNCTSTNFFTDHARCLIVCEDCGYVIDDSNLTTNLNFQAENGAAILSGQIIEMTQKFAKINSAFVQTSSYYIESKLQSICTALSLPLDFSNSAFRWYKLALQYNLSKAKNIIYTLSGCLYLVCREKQTPHFLVDFAVTLNIDVYKVGKLFLKLLKFLKVNVDLNDPSIYLPRYSMKLQLSNCTTQLALRIIMRMKRDWITIGRRPNNLCGAAILIASRINNEERSISDIAFVVNGTVSTINKRLKEITETETANLSVKEFLSVWLEKEEDPPVCKNRKNSKLENNSDKYIFSNLELHSDSEMNNAICTADEFNEKEKIWNELYGEYMHWKESKPEKKVKKRKRRKVSSVKEAIEMCVKEKKLTNKIDFDKLKELFD